MEAGEAEGTWVYRVQGYDSESKESTEWSANSAPVKVNKSAPNAIGGGGPRPDYAGKGGWYKDSVTVSFTDNGDPLLSTAAREAA